MTGITWAATKLFFKKAWLWLKTHWYVPVVLLYTAVLWVLFRRNAEAALEVLTTSKESYKAQIKTIEDSHALEIARRDKALAQYESIIRALEKEYETSREALSNDKKKKVKEYIEMYESDPDGLVKIMEEKFGIKYEPTNE